MTYNSAGTQIFSVSSLFVIMVLYKIEQNRCGLLFSSKKKTMNRQAISLTNSVMITAARIDANLFQFDVVRTNLISLPVEPRKSFSFSCRVLPCRTLSATNALCKVKATKLIVFMIFFSSGFASAILNSKFKLKITCTKYYKSN